MQSIAGILRFDEQEVEIATVERMLARMNRTGVLPVSLWGDGPIALGGLLPPGSKQGVAQPSTLSGVASMRAHDLWLAADARIDNRKELLQQLGQQNAELPNRLLSGDSLHDEQFILACYAKWGEDAPAHLIGDYAFALWDGKQRTLFCARDHFGLRPLYIYSCAQFFIFASELQALFAHPEVPRRINEVRVALHLAVELADNRITFYRDIERLLPAHSLTITNGRAAVQKQYWSLSNCDELFLPSDEEYADAFQAVFREAVACRLPQERPIGAFLSGGLDSTAVTCMVHELIGADDAGGMLHTFSAIFEQTPECDERRYIDETLQLGGITPHFVDVEATSPLAKIDQMVSAIGEPFPAPTLYILWGLYEEASRQGMRVVLDGLDGDTAVHHGDAYLAELARISQWPRFFQLAKAIAQRKKLPSLDPLMHRYGEPYLADLASQWRWHKLHKELEALAPYATTPTRELFHNYVRDYSLRPLIDKANSLPARLLGRAPAQHQYSAGLASQRLVRQTNLQERIRAQTAKPPTTSRQEHYRQLTTPLLPQLFEISTRTARTFGIDARHPFTDRRLVEFCYALPPQQKVADGWTRNIVRRGLAGSIPEAIRQRGDKAENSRAVTKAFLTQDVRYLGTFLEHGVARLAEYVDVPMLQGIYQRYQATGNERDEMLIWQAVTLASWLEHTERGV